LNQEFKELLVGCGNSRKKYFNDREWKNLVTLDIDPYCLPDVRHDLNVLPYPFENNEFDEIHAYEVLEHCGTQGDYKQFLAQFSEFWRILKPDGMLYATVPIWNGLWSFGDPGHTRIINQGTLVFLSQKEYEKQIGVTAMTDYRYLYKADFDIEFQKEANGSFVFALKAIKAKKENPQTSG
jgi:SAM-dependent methyltransferase